MTVVNPKSISGINSITTGSGSDNLLTIHTSDASSTERVRINSSGDVIVGSGITVSPDGDIFATGVTTSTTFSGNFSGGTVSGTTGTFTSSLTINTTTDQMLNLNSTDNGGTYIGYQRSGTRTAYLGHGGTGGTFSLRNEIQDGYVTITGNDGGSYIDMISLATSSNGDATFSGNLIIPDKIVHSGDTNTAIRFPAADTITAETGGSERIRIQSNGNTGIGTITTQNNARLQVSTNQQVVAAFEGTGVSDPQIYLGDDMTTPTDNCIILGYDKADNRGYLTVGGDADTVFQVKNGGDIEIGVGNLKFGTSGKGIDFSATGDSGGTTSSELFDDYEEGTCVPTQVNGSFSPSNTDGRYTKIGRMCTWVISIQFDSTSSSNHLHIGNFPFTIGGGRAGGGFVRYSNNGIAYKLGFHPNAGEARAGVYYTDGGSITPSSAVSNTRFDIVFIFETA